MDDLGPTWLNILFWIVALAYVFFIDRRMNEAFVRLIGVGLLFGLVVFIVSRIVQHQVDDSFPQRTVPVFYSYFMLSSLLCALLGRRALTKPELDQVSAMLLGKHARADQWNTPPKDH